MTQTWDIDTIVPASSSPSADIQKIVDGFSALRSCFSGAIEPASADQVAYMFWADTATGLLKQRNAANSAWVTIGTMATIYLGLLSLAGGNLTGGINAAKTTVASATTPDIFAVTVGNTVDYTGTATATGFATAPQAGCQRMLVCSGAAVFTAGASLLIDGVQSASNFTAAAGDKLLAIAVTTTQFRLTPMRYDGAAMTSSAPTQTFRGLSLRSHPDSDVANTKIMMTHADEIVLNDSFKATPADRLVFDKSVTGSAGGMQAAAVVSTWNKIYYIRKRSDGTEGLYGLRAKDYFKDTSFETAADGSDLLRQGASDRIKLAQGFQLATAGRVEFIDVAGLSRNGSPTGNVWFTIEADTAGNPSGTPLATSDKYDVSRLPTVTDLSQRFPFRNPATLSATTQYHLVLQGDYAVSGAAYIRWSGVVAGGYASGVAKKFDGTNWAVSAGVADFRFKVYVTRNDTAISLPAGYDQYAQIGWFYLDSGGLVKRFSQNNRRFLASRTSDWKIGQLANGVVTLTDLSAFIPPVQVEVVMLGTDTAGTYYSSLGKLHATDIAAVAEVDGSSNAAHLFVGATARPSLAWAAINLEYQAMLQICGSSSTHIWMGEFTW